MATVLSHCYTPPGLCRYSVRADRYLCLVKSQLMCRDNVKKSRPMGKPTICIGENKGADQLRGNREADQRLCFRYSDSIIPLLLKSEIASF